MKRPTDNSLRGLIRSKANQMSYRWLPVQRKPELNTSRGADIGRSLIEEIGFFPSKVWTLAGVFSLKAMRNPGFLTWLYVSLMLTVCVLPWVLIQAVVMQVWRTVRSLYSVLTGKVTYRRKSETKNK